MPHNFFILNFRNLIRIVRDNNCISKKYMIFIKILERKTGAKYHKKAFHLHNPASWYCGLEYKIEG